MPIADSISNSINGCICQIFEGKRLFGMSNRIYGYAIF
jgi:hypothetical protein